jgi:hypothetical protein
MEILKYNPCHEAIEYRKQFKTLKEAWEDCPRGDWMLYLAQKVGVDIHHLTYTKALCAETIIHLMDDERSRNAIKVAKKFGKHKATKEELKAAYASAYAAAYASSAHAAASAASAAAAYAAEAADAAAAASAASASAYAASASAYAADAYAAKNMIQLKTAKICRKYLTKLVFNKINKL